MRSSWLLGCILALPAACAAAPASEPSEGARFVGDEAYRRSELVASLVNPSNAYSTLRLAHYAGGDRAWDLLPEWNPRVEPVAPSDLGAVSAGGHLGSTASALDVTARADDEAAMRALGEEAFFRYPAQLATYAATALVSRASAERYGVWIDDSRGEVGGFVRAEMADGTALLAATCSTCHVATGSAGLLVGAGSDQLDFGRLLADSSGAGPDDTRRTWGRGRVDVTTQDGSAPERIPDVRPTRWLTYLHQEATVAKRDRTALAIRLETLIITSHGQTLRPPRVLVWALATYLESLADDLPASSPPAGGASERGAQTFAATCSGCHAGAGLTGDPVALDVVGTDPAIGQSSDRGTGKYRVPSLHGVGTRGLLLHDASLPSLAAMFDPTRTQSTFAGGTRGPGAVPGHVFGLDLSDAERSDLATYLGSL